MSKPAQNARNRRDRRAATARARRSPADTHSQQSNSQPGQELEAAQRLHRAGDLDGAAVRYAAILDKTPDHLETLNAYAILLLQKGGAESAKALDLLTKAVTAAPNDATVQMHYGVALQAAGEIEKAETALRTAIELKPDYADAYNNLGTNLRKQERIAEAIQAFEQATSIDPTHQSARRNQDGLRRAMAQSASTDIEAILAEAGRLKAAGHYANAVNLYEKAKGHIPGGLPIRERFNYADALRRSGAFAEAQQELTELLDNQNAEMRARLALAMVAYDQADYEEAITQIDQIPEESDDNPDTYHIRANCLRYMNQPDSAETFYKKALEHTPKDPAVRNDFGIFLSTLGRSAEASIQLLQSIADAPQAWRSYNNLGNILKDQGRILDALELYQNALHQCGENQILRSNLIFCLNYIGGLSKEAVFEEHCAFQHAVSKDTPAFEFDNARDPDRRLRIGFVSSDFRTHSVARFFDPLLDAYDRDRLEIFLYANVNRHDHVSESMRQRANAWRPIHSVPDTQVCEQIRKDRIDILVDLNGHTGGNRLPLFAHKPAPVQVSWLGCPNTTGLSEIDYRLVDEITEPSGTADAFSTETIVRLPNGFHCFRPPAEAGPVTPSPCLKTGQVTFGSFNYLAKINEEVVQTWCEILNAVPNSQILLKARGLGDVLSNQVYIGLFEKYGVSRDRVTIVPFTKTIQEHLQVYANVDIALDTFPYNGTTTTCEALWMGVPVVALLGDNHASRVSASLLSRLGLERSVGKDKEDYVRRAVDLASDPKALDDLRQSIRPAMKASPLRDEAGFARDFETALRQMWRDWCRTETSRPHTPRTVSATTVATEPKDQPQDIRVLHHLARTGGTLISKCLGSMNGIVLLSEAHPQGLTWIDAIDQADRWFGLLEPGEATDIRRTDNPFEELIARAATRCREQGKTLVVRDWTHLDYTAVPFIATPGYRLTTAECLAGRFSNVINTATVRHPIDEWLSLNRLKIVQGRITVAEYLRGYRKFAEDVQDIGFLRYEDFTHDPDTTLQTLCSRLDLPFDGGYRERWASYDRITGDVTQNRPADTAIKPVRQKTYEPEIISAFEASPDYRPALELLGYDALQVSKQPEVLSDG